MAKQVRGPEPQIAARLQIERVPYRSAAWCELWRRLFEAIAADFAQDAAGISGVPGAAVTTPVSGEAESA